MSEWKDKGPGQVEEIIFYAVLVEFQGMKGQYLLSIQYCILLQI